MKSTSKFVTIMLVLTAFFCCAVAVGVGAGFNAVRESTDKKIIAVAEKVREEYPDISEQELEEIFEQRHCKDKRRFCKVRNKIRKRLG